MSEPSHRHRDQHVGRAGVLDATGERGIPMIPRSARAFALLVVLALVALACGGEAAPLGAPEDSGATGGEDGAGAGDETTADALDGDPIRVGFLVDETGALADYGHAHRLVGEAAARRINEEGGIDGRPLELVIADTESDPSAAAPRARRLVDSDGVDFLLGSNTSGVVLAVAPIAEETETVYFPTAGGALLTTPGTGNRYVFDINTDVRQETLGVTDFIVGETDATKWVTVVADYAWGWDQEESFAEAAAERGLEVLEQVRVPLGTSDFLGYLRGSLPDDAEGVYFANFGTDFLAFIRDLHAIQPDLVKIGGNYVLSGQRIDELGEPAEGLYVVTGYPQNAAAVDNPYDAEYREWIGMDELGREKDSGQYLVASYQWSTWESLHAIKRIVEESGWQSRDDVQDFITTLEGYQFEQSLDFPEGDKHFRPEDHLSVKGAWIEQIVDGELVLAHEIPAEPMIYEPLINYPAEDG